MRRRCWGLPGSRSTAGWRNSASSEPAGHQRLHGEFREEGLHGFGDARNVYWSSYYANARVITGIYKEGVLTMDIVNIDLRQNGNR